MRWLAIAAATVLTLGQVGCDKIPFLAKESESAEAADTAAVAEAQETTPTEAPATAPAEATPTPTPPPEPVPQVPLPLVDEPWEPLDTGTVRSGMSRAQVIAQWGVPVAERQVAGWTYLYFRNGCEVTCGTFDVVFLEGDQVVDAIVRGPGHTYAGVSSSPPERAAEFTPPLRPGGQTGVRE
jgi:hypothetical protein